MISYIVDWGNGFIGGYDEDLDQNFNTPKGQLFDSLQFYGVKDLNVITPEQLDSMREKRYENIKDHA